VRSRSVWIVVDVQQAASLLRGPLHNGLSSRTTQQAGSLLYKAATIHESTRKHTKLASDIVDAELLVEAEDCAVYSF
jgi:hypothetical protein